MKQAGPFITVVHWLVFIQLLGGAVWAQAPSLTPDMPPEVKSWRDEILSREEYARLEDEWRTYGDRHPTSAVALIQVTRAQRYAQSASAGEQQKLIRRAYELDPRCPEVLDAMACTALHMKDPMTTPEEAREYGERAVELAPRWPTPHFTLWSLAKDLGLDEEADAHLEAILEKGGFPPPLLDYAYNMLVSAAPGGIVFTNGDNDTYPVLALQVVRGIRTDVLIVNISLLTLERYAGAVWKDASGDRAPFSAREIGSLRREWQRESPTHRELFSTVVIRALLDQVRDGSWTGPVYFALTVSEGNLEVCDLEREIEGLLWRVTRDPKEEDEDREPRVNLARTHRLLSQDFRLESATSFGFRWTPESAIRPLMMNYPAVLRLVAAESAEEGDRATVRYALREALRILDFHGQEEMVRKMAEYWEELDPGNPEIDPWL